MMQALRAQLPSGSISQITGKGLTATKEEFVNSADLPSVELLFSRGWSEAKIGVQLGRLPSNLNSDDFINCPDAAYHPHSKCVDTSSADGRRYVEDKSPADDSKPLESQRWTVQLVSPTNNVVIVTEEGKPTLPIDMKVLESIADNEIWRHFSSLIPLSSNAVASNAGSLITKQIANNLSALISDKMRISDEGGEKDFAHLTVDDGIGKSLVTINVQKWSSVNPALQKLFATAGAMPDGTRVRTGSQHPAAGGTGTTEFVADTCRKDGYRIIVTAINAPSYRVAATRVNPALTIEKLKGIALSNTWEKFRDRAAEIK